MAIGIAIALAVALVPATARADCALDRRIFPIPVWATSPNEGSTWGVMPIWMAVCPTDRRTHWILAPSATWNSIVHYTGTVRWFVYPDLDTELTVIAAGSTRHNYLGLLAWQRLPIAPGAWTYEATARVERNVFTRFFGIGPDTDDDDETSYTTRRVLAGARVGRNLGGHLNAGGTLEAGNTRVEPEGIAGLPLATAVFPGVPGMTRPSTIAAAGVALRYDDRAGGDFAARGTRVKLWGELAIGVRDSPTFLRGGLQASTIFPETERLAGAARVFWSGVSSARVPFHAQSTLGGSNLMRGFIAGRFVAPYAWTAEVEQRIRIVRTRFFGVTTDWRVDPFVAVGQVYEAWSSIASHPRLSVGAGLRAFVHPTVLGRVDFAYAGEGLAVYVELGYPY